MSIIQQDVRQNRPAGYPTAVNVPAKFEVRIIALPVPEIIAIEVLGGGCELVNPQE